MELYFPFVILWQISSITIIQKQEMKRNIANIPRFRCLVSIKNKKPNTALRLKYQAINNPKLHSVILPPYIHANFSKFLVCINNPRNVSTTIKIHLI